MKKLRAGLIKRIHVNQQIIRQNTKLPRSKRRPPLTVQCTGGPFPGWEISIEGKSKLIYSPDKALGSGARLWIETKAEVQIR